MTRIYYDPDYTAADFAFDTTRKSAVINQILQDRNVFTYAPEISDESMDDIIARSVSPEYVSALMTGPDGPYGYLSETSGFTWCANTYKMARAHANGTLSALSRALFDGGIHGSLSSGAHHAEYYNGNGFCTLNSLAIAAHSEIDAGIVDRVLILDLDAHNGGGTVSQLRTLGIDDVVHQIDVSTNKFDMYDTDAKHQAHVLPSDLQYLSLIQSLVEDALSSGDYGAVLYNAGTDPAPGFTNHRKLADRDAIVFDAVAEHGIPCAFILAGGYTHDQTMEELAQSHINTVDRAMEHGKVTT